MNIGGVRVAAKDIKDVDSVFSGASLIIAACSKVCLFLHSYHRGFNYHYIYLHVKDGLHLPTTKLDKQTSTALTCLAVLCELEQAEMVKTGLMICFDSTEVAYHYDKSKP